MQASSHRHDRTDKVWELLEPYLHGREGAGGVMAHGDRHFRNVAFWLLRLADHGEIDYLTTGTGKISIVVLWGGEWCVGTIT